MKDLELKISINDWIYIVVIGALFGFGFSYIFYLLNPVLNEISTLIFGTLTASFIALFASILITISNNKILPKIKKRYWNIVSFIFSFFSGVGGFLYSYILFVGFNIHIIDIIKPFLFQLSIIIGILTFLVGLILYKFISMKYINENMKNEILESKLKVLENELNPHFLFNSLTSVSELIFIDQKKAEKCVLDISKFLRNVISDKSLVTFNEEIEMVKTYLQIQNVRFDDNIKLNINNPNNIDTLIPKFSIQLIVENGIKHGFNEKEFIIDVDIDYESIKISNNGILNKNLHFKTGLNNLKRRLILLNIGDLRYYIKENKMYFEIVLR